MTYKRFEDLPVWKAAIRLAEEVDDFTRALDRGVLSFSQRDQIERASLSVSNNIAEGFERGTTKELLAFLSIASGSSGEVRSMTHFSKAAPTSPTTAPPSSPSTTSQNPAQNKSSPGPTSCRIPTSKAVATKPIKRPPATSRTKRPMIS